MVNSKQKSVPEGVRRSPGKSKFSIPRKEAPPIDGSYLDRLFADYDKQTQELQGQTDADLMQAVKSPERPAFVEQTTPPEVDKSVAVTSAAAPDIEIPEQMPPTGPVPFPHKEADSHYELTPVVSVPSEGRPAAGAKETLPNLRKRKPRIEPSNDFEGDSQLLDRWKKKHRLGKGEVKVLKVMLGLCGENDENACYIKISWLMQAAELKERQTQMVLRSLCELGLIEKVGAYSNLDRMGTKYRVVLSAD